MIADQSTQSDSDLESAIALAEAFKEELQRGKTQLTLNLVLPQPSKWIEDNVFDFTTVNLATFDYNRAARLRLTARQRRIIDHCLTPQANGRLRYDTVVWSEPKKSGKTMIAAAVGAYFAANVGAPNIIYCVANTEQQSSSRIFGQMAPTIFRLVGRFPTSQTARPVMQLPNGTLVRAIPNNYSAEAGGNYGLTLWSETWAMKQAGDQRLWDELVPVPTRPISLRWVETYAGFSDEDTPLRRIFLQIFQEFDERALCPGVRQVAELSDLPCYELPDARLFVYWSHEHTMPWQLDQAGQDYYTAQRLELTANTYRRLHENWFVQSTGAFLDETTLARSLQLAGPLAEPMIFAADASQRRDTTALVGARRVSIAGDDYYQTGYVQVWDPRGQDIDLEATLAETVRTLWQQGLLRELWYDPFQLHQVMLNLRREGIPVFEFNQGIDRVKSDTFLMRTYRAGRIQNYHTPDLLAHLRAARIQEQEAGRVRLIKGTLSTENQIDAAVAQSMAVWKASLREPEAELIAASDYYSQAEDAEAWRALADDLA
jgi:hypothetical protein